MSINPSLYSSNSDEWETPDDLFNRLNSFFNFTLDAAASSNNTKCKNFFDINDNALTKDWMGTIWCNPPYTKGQAYDFVQKGKKEICSGNADLVCFLIPARTDTILWHELIFPSATYIEFLKGRLKFKDNSQSIKPKSCAPFPSALIFFSREFYNPCLEAYIKSTKNKSILIKI